MRVPDYGNGNWEIKTRKNKNMPYIKDIGAYGDTIFIALSQAADSIKVFGQHHTTLLKATACEYAGYTMKKEDPYARFTVYFPSGEVIFTNPFARYDASKAESPVRENLHSINIAQTVLFNAALLLLFILLVITFYKSIIKK
jgi:hypothetical protein